MFQIVKANYVESIVPTITKLKRMLAGLKSPLVKDLMICLRELMKDFKNEAFILLLTVLIYCFHFTR